MKALHATRLRSRKTDPSDSLRRSAPSNSAFGGRVEERVCWSDGSLSVHGDAAMRDLDGGGIDHVLLSYRRAADARDDVLAGAASARDRRARMATRDPKRGERAARARVRAPRPLRRADPRAVPHRRAG